MKWMSTGLMTVRLLHGEMCIRDRSTVMAVFSTFANPLIAALPVSPLVAVRMEMRSFSF